VPRLTNRSQYSDCGVCIDLATILLFCESAVIVNSGAPCTQTTACLYTVGHQVFTRRRSRRVLQRHYKNFNNFLSSTRLYNWTQWSIYPGLFLWVQLPSMKTVRHGHITMNVYYTLVLPTTSPLWPPLNILTSWSLIFDITTLHLYTPVNTCTLHSGSERSSPVTILLCCGAI